MVSATDQILTKEIHEVNVTAVNVRYELNGFTHQRRIKPYTADDENMEPWCRMDLTFRNTMKDWGCNNGTQATQGANMFACYPQFLEGNARETWELCRSNYGATSLANFQNCKRDFVIELSSETARNQVAEYLLSEHVRKKHNEPVMAHVKRLRTLMIYHDMLPGNSQLLTDGSEQGNRLSKEIVLLSFPLKWRADFRKSRGDWTLPTVEVSHIATFMRDKKVESDMESQFNRMRRGGGRGRNSQRGGGRGHSNRGFRQPGRGHSRPSHYSPYPPNNYNNRNPPNRYGNTNYGNYNNGNNYRSSNGSNYRNNNGRGPTQGNRAPMNSYGGRNQPPRQNFHFQQEQDSHFIQQGAESSVPDGNVPEGNQAEMPSAEMHNAEQHYHYDNIQQQAAQHPNQPDHAYQQSNFVDPQHQQSHQAEQQSHYLDSLFFDYNEQGDY